MASSIFKMFKKLNLKILIFVASIIIISSYLLISTRIGNDKFKKYIFPYKLISLQQQTISQQQQTTSQQQQVLKLVDWSNLELLKKQEGSEIILKDSIVKLSNNKTLKKYNLTSGFYAGIENHFPGSGYIDFHKGNIIVLSSRGVLAFKKNIEDTEENFQQIKNNINEFIGINQFKKDKWFSLKDIYIFNNKVFISYTEEIKENCWNTSVIYGDMSYKNIEFKKLFSPKECVHSTKNIDSTFNAHQSGGRIISFDDNHILLTVGDYRSRHLAQDIKSVNGKIIKINIFIIHITIDYRCIPTILFDFFSIRNKNFIIENKYIF